MKLSALTLLAAMTEQRKTLLMQKYNCTPEQIATVEEADPTASGTYSDWILRRWLVDNQFHLPEDAAGPNGLKATLRKFDTSKGKAAWKALFSSDVNSYSYQTLQEAVAQFKDPNEISIPQVAAPIIYEGQGAILWKVPKGDWESLWELGKAGKAGWCTGQQNNSSYAKHYISTGPIYVCYLDGKPYFQYMPGGQASDGRHENPQFMDRFNTAFMKTTMMDEKAYNILKAVPNEPDLVQVTEQFRPPDMTEAGTLKYLSEVLALDKDYWKRSPEFREKELRFIKARYPHLDPDELTALCNKYPRTGELVKDFINENPNVKKLNEKLSSYETLQDFKKDFYSRGDHNIVGIQGKGVFDEDEKSLIVHLPPLFDKVFALYRKGTDFDTKFSEMKTLAAAKDPQALTIAKDLVQGIQNNFSGYSYRSNDPGGVSFVFSGADKAARKFVDIVKSVVRPIIKGIYAKLEEELPAYTQDKLYDLYTKLREVRSVIQNAFPSDDNVNLIIKEKEEEIKKKKATELFNQIPKEEDLATSVNLVRKLENGLSAMGSGDLLKEMVEMGVNQIIRPKLKEALDKIVAEKAGDYIAITTEITNLRESTLKANTLYSNEYTDKTIGLLFAKESEPIIQKRYTDLAASNVSAEELLTKASNILNDASLLGIKNPALYSSFLESSVAPQIKKEFETIATQAETLPNLDYFALLLNKRDVLSTQIRGNTSLRELLDEEFKKYGTEPLTQQLASLTKLKHVTDQLEAWDLTGEGWVEEIAENRKKEIREGRAAKQVDRDGAPRTRFAPKAEFEKWKQDFYQWRRQPEADRGPKPKVSEKTEAFILASPSSNDNDIRDYFEFIDEVSPAYQKWLLEKHNWHLALNYLKKVAKTWPELGDALIRFMSPGHPSLDEYKNFIYKDTVWPEYETKVLDGLSNGRWEYTISYIVESNKGKWAPFEAKLKEFVLSPDFREKARNWQFEREFLNPLLSYVEATGRLSDKEVEKTVCSIRDFAISYLTKLIPKDRISELLDKFEEHKEGSKKDFITVLMKELERV